MDSNKPQIDVTEIFDTVEFPDAYKISYLANAMIIPTYEDVFREFGLFRAEYHLLMCLAHYPVLAAHDVARMTRMPRNTISRAVKRMERDGFLTRAPDQEDKRKARLTLTIEGRKIHDAVAAAFVQREAELLDILSKIEREQFRETLAKLSVHASKLDR